MNQAAPPQEKFSVGSKVPLLRHDGEVCWTARCKRAALSRRRIQILEKSAASIERVHEAALAEFLKYRELRKRWGPIPEGSGR